MGHLPSPASLSPSNGGSNEKHDTVEPSLDSEKAGYQYEPMSGQRHDRNRAKERIIWISTAPPSTVDDPSGRTAVALVLSTVLVLVVNAGIWALAMTGPGSWVSTGSGVGVGGVGEPSVIGTATVDLNYTTYEGLQLSNGVNAFWGMRYAAPPLGGLRWRAPQEPVVVEGVQSAKTIPPLCLGINRGYPSAGESEDCLYVNVWAPSNATQTSKLPVWLFIQGGGYVANTNGNWDGNEVVEKSGHNVVMVNFNYRVGLWGFLASERVRDDGVLNAGLLDQRLLLKWVQTHIASFGGDPSHVVIHGASAGAGSVATHLVAYGGRNEHLFIGGISQSLFFPAQPYVRELEYQFDRVVRQAGCDNGVQNQDQMACLRGKDAAVLQGANVAQPFPGRDDPPMPLFYWAPCVDGEILTDVPYRLFEKGEFLRVPMVVGTNANEGATFAPNAASQSDIAVFFRNNYPLLTANDTDDILAQYPLQPPLPQHEAWFPSASQAYGEATFICPSQNVLSFLQQKGNGQGPAMYAYRFEVLDQEYVNAGIGVPHLFDAPAIFGPHAITAPTAVAASYSTYNAAVVPRVMAYYLSFVRALDPNVYRAPGAARWEEIGGGGVGSGGVGGTAETFGVGKKEHDDEGEDQTGGGEVMVDVDISPGKPDESRNRNDLMTRRRRRTARTVEARKGNTTTPGRAKRLVIRTEGSTMEETDQGEWKRCGFWNGLAGGRMRQR